MDEDLCIAISEKTGESLEVVQNLSLQEKTELAQALGLQQGLTSTYDKINDRKRKLEDDEIEQLLCDDDDVDKSEEYSTQQSGNLKRKKSSPPSSPVFRRSQSSRHAKEKLLLGGKDEKAEHERCGSSEELWQFGSAGGAGLDIPSGQQVGIPKLPTMYSPGQVGRGNEWEQLDQSLGFNAGEVKPFACEEDLSSEQLEGFKSGDFVTTVKFGEFSINSCENQGALRDEIAGAESLHLPTFLATEARRGGKSSDMVKKLAKVSLIRTSNPFTNLPKCPILQLGRFENANQASSSGESKDLQSSLASFHLQVQQLKKGGLSLASSPTLAPSWQSLVQATDQARSSAGPPGRLSSGRLSSKPEPTNVAKDKVPKNEEITDDDNIDGYISDEDNIEEVESGDDEEYTPKKDGLEWWRKKDKPKVKRSKRKRGGKRRKPCVEDHQSISKYFKPEVAEIEDADNDDEEVVEVREVAEVGNCPLCGQGFADLNQLSTHASNCQDIA